MKVLLAMENGLFPPNANFHNPSPRIPLDANGPFAILSQARKWDWPKQGPRRAAVSGFGFGGINAHLLVEEWISVGQTFLSAPGESDRQECLPHVGPPPAVEEPIAVIGLGARCGSAQNLQDFQQLALGFQSEQAGDHLIEELSIPAGKFRIPPKEFAEMLPQQTLLLLAVDEALDSCAKGNDPLRTGVFIGVNLDLNTTNFHLRWAAGEAAQSEGRPVATAMDEVGPPLSPERTLGALASVAASRVARTYRIGGPSITVSSEETSGLTVTHRGCTYVTARDGRLCISWRCRPGERSPSCRGGQGVRA